MPNLFAHKPSLTELEEDEERLEGEDRNLGTQLSIAQKRAAIKRLKERGLSPKHFSSDWGRIISWLKSH